MTDSKKPKVEEFIVDGTEVKEKVKQLLNEGNIRRLTIKTKEGKTVLEIPVTVGVIGVVLAPILAAVGAAAALLTECTIAVEREA